MVVSVDSFSDDSTHDKDVAASSVSLKSGNLSSAKLSPIIMAEHRDIEQNVSRATIVKKSEEPPPKLIHPALLKIPMQVRFGLAGTLSNVVFMIMYNTSVPYLDKYMAASTIYAIVYFVFIPISHALTSLIVFGWPKEYGTSLLSNFPIGLSAILIGAGCTAYLDRIHFEVLADDFVRMHVTHSPRIETDDVEELGEFYSSLVVMTITGVWSYVASVMVNKQMSDAYHEKEL